MFVGIIWRPTPDRTPAFEATVNWWTEQGADIRFFDSGHNIFNRAASRNLAARTARKEGYKKLVISDADCIPEIGPVTAAWNATDDERVHLPYDRCRVLNGEGAPIGEFSFTCGGVYITTPNAWFRSGGQDERFTRWAPEDFAFMLANRTLGHDLHRHAGLLLSLSHNRDEQTPAPTDVSLYRDYEAADGNLDSMRALCFPSS